MQAALSFASHYTHGTCGTGLECMVRNDVSEEEAAEGPVETTCYCTDDQPRCGTNNQTYATLCAINEEIALPLNSMLSGPLRNQKKTEPLAIKHVGPCHSQPEILQPLENHVGVTPGANIMFTCDIVGFPLPQISWQLQTVEGEVRILPDGDGRISVSSRGAARPDHVTSWLQIIQVAREHEGDYTCTVENGIGKTVQSTGRLLVMKTNGKDETRRRRRYQRSVDDDQQIVGDDIDDTFDNRLVEDDGDDDEF